MTTQQDTPTTYQPIAGSQRDLKLCEPSRKKEFQVHEIMVRFPGHPVEERKHVCAVEKWKPEERIPELASDTRISVDALRKMLVRLEGKPAQLRKEMQNLVDRYGVDNPVEPVSADEYWHQMASTLFVSFPEDTDPGDINFREVRRAYYDFFEG